MSRLAKAQSSIYVHIPYCIKKCPYCDFNSYATSKEEVELSENSYIESLLIEAKNSNWQQDIETIFIGGGTPSLLSEKAIENLLNGLAKTFKIKNNAEVTLETNPGSISEPLYIEKLKSFKNSGINRISLGIQSFNDKKLKFLGRIHNSKQSLVAIDNVRKSGINNFNLDLIYAIKDENLDEWKNDLAKTLEQKPTHISAYTLTIEPGTDFGKQSKKGSVLTASDEVVSKLYTFTQEELNNHGYKQYEVSNFSMPDMECRHNLTYWSYNNYLGLGAGAHSFKDNKRWINLLKPQSYVKKIASEGLAKQREEELNKTQQQIEIIYTCLRKSTGMDLRKIEINKEIKHLIKEFIEQKLILKNENNIRYTKKGYMFSDYIVRKLSEAIES